MPIGKVWIYRLLFVCFCVFARLRITPARIKLAASNLARSFIGVLGRESPILGNCAPPEAQNRTNRRAATSIADRRQSPPLTASAKHARARRRHVWIYGRPRRRMYLYHLIDSLPVLYRNGDLSSNISILLGNRNTRLTNSMSKLQEMA